MVQHLPVLTLLKMDFTWKDLLSFLKRTTLELQPAYNVKDSQMGGTWIFQDNAFVFKIPP